MDESRLISFINGKASEAESKEIIAWIEASEENRDLYNSIKNTFALNPPPHFFSMLDDSEVIPGVRSITGESRARVIIMSSLKYAAAIIILIAVSFITYYHGRSDITKELNVSYNTVVAPPGQTSEVTFPDGSVAILNSSTKIAYPSDYSVDNRSVKLEGEAMFNVKTNPDIPFTVEAKGIVVKATGTSFNVDAYSDEKEINITLVEGVVDLHNSSGRFLSKMKPGENARIDLLANRLFITEVNTEYYVSWQKGIIMFSNRSLGDIALELERWYNVSIEFSDEKMKDIKYSGAILKNKPIDQVLEILKLTSQFDYKIDIKNNKASVITIK